MGRDSADLRAKAAVAIVAGMTAVCLLGAFAIRGVPRSRWFLLGPVLLVVAVPVLCRIADRSRIRHAVGELGGELLAIRRWPFWGRGFWEDHEHWTTYDVVFRDALGLFHLVTCRTGLLWAVQWSDEEIHADEGVLRAAAAGRGWRRLRFRDRTGGTE